MNSIEISLWVSEYRFKALEDTLRKQGAGTIEEKLRETFDTLYQEHVPDEQRAQIEARIEQEDAAEQAKLEANRRFAVYHIREDDEDFLFTNDYYQTPMQAAHRYRLYDRGELSSRPESFAGAFPESRTMRLEEFQAAAADIRSDPRITALLEFNLDEGWVSVCGRDNAWQTYGLQDFSVAAYKAYRSAYRGEDSRRENLPCPPLRSGAGRRRDRAGQRSNDGNVSRRKLNLEWRNICECRKQNDKRKGFAIDGRTVCVI